MMASCSLLRLFISYGVLLMFFPNVAENVGISSPPSYQSLFDEASSQFAALEAIYEDLHQHPELKFQEYYTSAFIKRQLTEYNISFTGGWSVPDHNTSLGGTGVVAEIGTGKAPCVALRADFDALPILEEANVSFQSLNVGRMHACGHDAHTTMLLGAARLLKQHESELQGTVRFLFQPAEEGGGGAKHMVREGVLTADPPVQRVFGLHVDPGSATNSFSSRPGTLLAAADSFTIIVKGVGGHAAMHHLAIDPIPAATAIVRAFYDIYARELYFQHPYAGLISVAKIQGGTAPNVIPAEVELMGTLRTITAERLDYLRSRVVEVAEKVASAYRCSVSIQFKVPHPPCVNDEATYFFFSKVISEATGNTVREVEPFMVSEDFAFYGEKVPSFFTFIGIGSGGSADGSPPTNAPLHTANFVVDKSVLPVGSAIHAHVAFQTIDELLKAVDIPMDASTKRADEL